MKSIREWMIEHGVGRDDVDNVDLVRILGSSSLKINRDLRVKLHPKLQQILKDPELSEIAERDPSELLRQIIAVAANEISGNQGSNMFSTSKTAAKLTSNNMGSDDPIAKEVQ